MKNLIALLITGILFQFSSSCSQGNGNQNQRRNFPESGKIHENIVCQAAPGFSYALYLPKAFPGTKSWPVILMFDPHGAGSLPVTNYKVLAEKYGYIIAGSNNSKNGLAPEQTGNILNALFDEVRQEYPLDTGRIYTAGFSGGSRVAGLAAMFRKDVRGVIGCGAGLPGVEQPPVFRFDYFGIAGMADFNMTELVQLDETFNQAGLRHFVETYPGKHAWPPAPVMEDGILWHHFNAMKDGRAPKDENLVRRFGDSISGRMEAMKSRGNFIGQADLNRMAISFLEGLTPVDKYKQQLAATESSAGYRKQVVVRNDLLKKEQAEQQELMQALFTKDLPWWNNKIRDYDLKMKRSSSPDDTLMIARVRAYVSLLCYSNVNAAMKQNNHEMAGKLVVIYELVEPSNPEPNYLTAVLRSWASDSTACFNELGKAISKGFSDKGRIRQQREFENYRNSPRFFDLIKKMK